MHSRGHPAAAIARRALHQSLYYKSWQATPVQQSSADTNTITNTTTITNDHTTPLVTPLSLLVLLLLQLLLRLLPSQLLSRPARLLTTIVPPSFVSTTSASSTVDFGTSDDSANRLTIYPLERCVAAVNKSLRSCLLIVPRTRGMSRPSRLKIFPSDPFRACFSFFVATCLIRFLIKFAHQACSFTSVARQACKSYSRVTFTCRCLKAVLRRYVQKIYHEFSR